MTRPTEAFKITVLASGTTVPFDSFSGRIAYRGELVEITPEQYDGTLDRFGNSWLDMDEHAQAKKWGMVRFLRGDHTADVAFIGDDDSTVRYRRRENAIATANAISDPAERRAAHAEVNRVYGRAESTQRTTRSFE
ncbi:hypothetical protein [Microbacterium sp. NPDC097977]|uniref:hypothetical protein n=1 Tax=Microbacterium sp. NPDC097977 TaxID=3155686 RepID=UPI0033305769